MLLSIKASGNDLSGRRDAVITTLALVLVERDFRVKAHELAEQQNSVLCTCSTFHSGATVIKIVGFLLQETSSSVAERNVSPTLSNIRQTVSDEFSQRCCENLVNGTNPMAAMHYALIRGSKG